MEKAVSLRKNKPEHGDRGRNNLRRIRIGIEIPGGTYWEIQRKIKLLGE